MGKYHKTIALYAYLDLTFWYSIHLSPDVNPLLPGPDVPDPDAADGGDHQDGEEEDAPQNGDDDMLRIGWFINNYEVILAVLVEYLS